jgi:YD repeat-containing protein
VATHTSYTQLGQIAWQRASVMDPARPGIPGEADSELWRRYTYGSDDELSGIHDRHAGHTLFEYDRAGQLVRRSADNFDTERFVWDAAGNLLDDAGHAMGTKLPALMDNLLRQYRGVQYRYDAWGQLVRRNNLSLTWDAEGHLLSVDDGVRHTAYRYDALGRRIGKTSQAVSLPGMPDDGLPGEETRFIWQGLRLLQEQRGNGQSRTYLYDPMRAYAPLARIDHARNSGQDKVYHYHTDPTGTVRDVTDEAGQHVWSGSYSAWGQVRANTASVHGFSQPLRMPGQYHDEESGL